MKYKIVFIDGVSELQITADQYQLVSEEDSPYFEFTTGENDLVAIIPFEQIRYIQVLP